MGRKKREFLTPELTPLIDVVFLLLIFFLVSSVFKKQESALNLQLPTMEKGNTEKLKNQEVTVEVSNDSFGLNGEKLGESELILKLSAFSKESSISIKADKNTRHQKFVRVLEILQKQDKKNIAIITEEVK